MARKKKDPIKDLKSEVREDFETEFEFEGDEMSTETEIDYTGKSVKFEDEGIECVGVVIGPAGDDGDDDEWKVETDENIYCMIPSEFTVVETEDESETEDDLDDILDDLEDKPSSKKKAPAKSKTTAKKAPAKKAPAKSKTTAKKAPAKKAPAKSKTTTKKAPAKKAPAKASGGGKKAPAKSESATTPKTSKKSSKKSSEASEVSERRMLAIDSIVIPDVKPRDVDPDSATFQAFVQDMKERGQRTSIEVHDLDSEKPILIEGLRRITAAKLLGWKLIEAQGPSEECESVEARLWHGTLANEMREAMHWTDKAKVFALLAKGGTYNQRKIARKWGLKEAKVSLMISCVSLPENVLELARTDKYGQSLFEELSNCPESVIEDVTDAMTEGRNVTISDIREYKKEAKKKAGETKEKKKAKKEAVKTLTSREVSASELGDEIKIKVKPTGLTLTIAIEHSGKTFRNFDIQAAIRDAFDNAFSDEATSISDFKGLNKVLTSLRAELKK